MKFRKITHAQEHQLIQIFLHMGQQAVAPICIEWGVAPGYARNRATELAMIPHRKIAGSGRLTYNVNHQDHRWAWAIERGAVIAP